MATSASVELLRVWVHATNRGTRQFLSAWWPGSEPSEDKDKDKDKDSAPPTPVEIAAICAPDAEDPPLEHHYTSYDSDGGCGCGDGEDACLELFKQLDAGHHAPPPSGSASRAAYTMYSSQKSGSAA